MRTPKYLQHILVGATAVVVGAAHVVSGDDSATAATVRAVSAMPGVAEAATLTDVRSSTKYIAAAVEKPSDLATSTRAALDAFAGTVRTLSHPKALEKAFASYYAYKLDNPGTVKKPYFYFVDYGLPSNAKRGWVFDMEKLAIVDGPFTVAHGSGSAARSELIPSRFSNAHGSNSTSLGLYLAQETYGFSGKAGGRRYTSVGLRMKGLSKGFNDNARTRGVVAHGAPYVTETRAGRSQGCPAVTQARARKLLPMLANGGMVFLFAPDSRWLANDQWLQLAEADLEAAGSQVVARANN